MGSFAEIPGQRGWRERGNTQVWCRLKLSPVRGAAGQNLRLRLEQRKNTQRETRQQTKSTESVVNHGWAQPRNLERAWPQEETITPQHFIWTRLFRYASTSVFCTPRPFPMLFLLLATSQHPTPFLSWKPIYSSFKANWNTSPSAVIPPKWN